MAAKPRALVAGLGLLAFLGVGALAAIIVDQTASLQAEADPQRIAEPAPKPAEAAVARPEEAAKPVVQTQEQGNQPPKQVIAKLPEQQPKPQATPVSKQEPKQEIAALPHNDPRWGRTAAVVPPALAALQAEAAPAGDSDLAAFAEPVPAVRPQPAPAPVTKSPGDPFVTAAISAAHMPIPIPTDPIVIPADGRAEANTTRQARIRTAVKLRTRGADEASVITVVPANATVGVVGCQSWCEIVYKNRRGWVYKGFVK